jgi:hypothetical protein
MEYRHSIQHILQFLLSHLQDRVWPRSIMQQDKFAKFPYASLKGEVFLCACTD